MTVDCDRKVPGSSLFVVVLTGHLFVSYVWFHDLEMYLCCSLGYRTLQPESRRSGRIHKLQQTWTGLSSRRD